MLVSQALAKIEKFNTLFFQLAQILKEDLQMNAQQVTSLFGIVNYTLIIDMSDAISKVLSESEKQKLLPILQESSSQLDNQLYQLAVENPQLEQVIVLQLESFFSQTLLDLIKEGIKNKPEIIKVQILEKFLKMVKTYFQD